jgi:hypothetical protein
VPGWRRGLASAFAVGVVLTGVMAWPVVASPDQLIFGSGIVGRHYDPFLVMMQLAFGGPWLYVQPATDWLGWLFARWLDPVAAYNLLVLSTFPLATMAAYALGRYLFASHAAAMLAGLAFAFAPAHLAQAAYHPHIAQTHWFPLYFLAVVAAIDKPSLVRLLWLVPACAGLVLSNFYAGLIGAVMTPVVLITYWWVSPRAAGRSAHLWRPALALTVLAASAFLTAWLVMPADATRQGRIVFPDSDVARYSARWWAYLTPPVDHAVLGPHARTLYERTGAAESLIEQQVYLGVALMLLAGAGIVLAATRWRREPQWRPVIACGIVAAVAALVSIGPAGARCGDAWWSPGCRLHELLPMFRAYARFGLIAQMGLALCAGAGAVLVARRSRGGLVAVACLVGLAAFEYAPVPWRVRDVLPTDAHRWLAGQPESIRVLDCAPPEPQDAQVGWLMKRRITFLTTLVPDCTDPALGRKLAALGYTHLLVRERHDTRPLAGDPPEGLMPVVQFGDSRVYGVTSPVPVVVAFERSGFYVFEHDGDDWWRWMGPTATWLVRNTTGEERQVSLLADLESAGESRTLEVVLDGQPAGSVEVGTAVVRVTLGPWRLGPGDHEMTLAGRGEPFRASDADPSADSRPLTIAVRNVRWIDGGEAVTRGPTR